MQSACQQRMTLLRLLLSCAAKNDVRVDWSRDRFNGCPFVGLMSAIRINQKARRHPQLANGESGAQGHDGFGQSRALDSAGVSELRRVAARRSALRTLPAAVRGKSPL
jgi:hypothetical protein